MALRTSSYKSRWCTAMVLAVLLAPAMLARGEELRPASLEQFRADVRSMEGLTDACAASAEACDASKVSEDEGLDSEGGFIARWGWLRDALKKAHDAKPDERAALMRDARGELNEWMQESGEPSSTAQFDKAKADAKEILSRQEFQHDETPNAVAKLLGKIMDRIFRLLRAMKGATDAAPWLGGVIEWGFFALAAAGLLFFLFRTLQRSQMRVTVSTGPASAAFWEKESEDWARLADASAQAGDWREAVHGLYWAAIVHLEGQRAWRHNPSRTPREYVRLLKAGTAQQKNLRSLTQIFERVWYGFGEVDGSAYAEARGFYDGLYQRAPTTTEAA